MEISEKVAYLKGLAEGLNLDTESKEGKLIAAIIDVLDDMAEKFADVEDELCDVEDGLDAVSDDLSDVEETLYFALDDDEDEDEDEDDEEEECFMTNCPECEEEVYFDESVLEDGEVICPIWPTMRTRIRSNSKNKKEPPRAVLFLRKTAIPKCCTAV